jgi:CDP-diacylglycerol--glycerol-3-phosphate 3-phosphatidyltransferase
MTQTTVHAPVKTWTLPNVLTATRIAITPLVAALPFIEGYWPKILCLAIFIAAAITDVIDGRLARRRNLVSDLGKKLDPLADKLLLVATLVPIWWISQQRHHLYDIPVWGSIPLWVCLLLLGRELAMTLFRVYAERRGVIIQAQGPGKLKTVFQSIFIGGTIAWFAFRDAMKPMGWEKERAALWWNQFHGLFVAVTLAIAAVLTVYSFVIYLYRYRGLFSQQGR